jgi:hypothetical protein
MILAYVSCRATVVEDREIWYKDDGPLSLILCEDVQKNETDHLDFDFPCCACDDALYEVTVFYLNTDLFTVIITGFVIN